MSSRRILVVDDDDGIRGFVQLALEDEGFEVLAARDGREALTTLGRQPVDLILLDMRMPGMDGWRFAEAYAAAPGVHAPIVVMTAARDEATLVEEVGAAAVIAKPFDLQDLIDIATHYAGR